MNRWSALLVCLVYSLAMAGTALGVHECGGTWMTEFSMMQPLGHSAAPMACHRSGCDHGCCQHPVFSANVHQDQLPSGAFSLRLFPVSRILDLESGRTAFLARQMSFKELSAHGPPGFRSSLATRQAWLSVYRI